jgi:hypothetical protein
MIIPLNPKKANHKKILELNTILVGFSQSIVQLQLQSEILKNQLKELYSKESINSDVQVDVINQELKF